MLFAYNGGMWRASPELITLLSACANTYDDVVILDLYENPIMVNVTDLASLALERWQEQMNGWKAEYNVISEKR